MNDIFLIISGIIMLLTLCITLTRQLHFLQLNSYFNSRFFEYLRGSFRRRTGAAIAAAVIQLLLIFLSPLSALIVTALFCAVRAAFNIYTERHAKKKIVFTFRIMRMYITFGIIALLCGLLYRWPIAFAVVTAALLLGSPLVAMALNVINTPVEAAFRRYFIKDAKRILREHGDMKVIGITGSYGKTGTKHILQRLLSEKYSVVMTPGSVNTPLGIVRVIREQLRPDTQIFLVEMGAKQVGDIREICELVQPDIGLITSIGPQHLSTFGSVENVIKTKFELADAVLARGGRIYLNTENRYIAGEVARRELQHTAYGGQGATVHAEDISVSPHGLRFNVCSPDGEFEVNTRLLGSHNVSNILAAAAICLDLGVSPQDISYAAGRLVPAQHRLELRPYIGGSLLIDDAYNANPYGSIEAMRVLGSFEGRRRIVVTPGLVELGDQEYEYNVKLGTAAAENADELFFVGIERSKPLVAGARLRCFPDEHLHIVKSFNEAAAAIRPLCDKQTVVLFENDLPDNYEK